MEKQICRQKNGVYHNTSVFKFICPAKLYRLYFSLTIAVLVVAESIDIILSYTVFDCTVILELDDILLDMRLTDVDLIDSAIVISFPVLIVFFGEYMLEVLLLKSYPCFDRIGLLDDFL